MKHSNSDTIFRYAKLFSIFEKNIAYVENFQLLSDLQGLSGLEL